MMRARTLATLVLMLTCLLPLAAGCTTYRESFAGVDPSAVWNAMIEAAEQPAYPDWVVTDNRVWVDHETSRVEIYREIKRDIRVPLSRVQRQERTLRHQMVLLQEADGPVVEFYGRSGGIPAREELESERYFAQLWRTLGGRPAVITPREPEHVPMTPIVPREEDAPPIDLDDID